MAIKKVIIDGKPSFEIFVKVRDKSGRQISRRKRGYPTQRSAEIAYHKLRGDLTGFQNRYTWNQWLEKCLAMMSIHYKKSTIIGYEKRLNKWMTPLFGESYLDEITPMQIHELIFEKTGSCSFYTKKGILKQIKRIFTLAVEEGVISRNPAAAIRVKVPEAVQGVLNHHEISILLSEAKKQKHEYYPVWATALLTGLRAGELYALKWSDVDFENDILSISRSWNYYNGFGPTKSSKNRVVPISSELKKLLLSLGTRKEGSEFVLPRLIGFGIGVQARILKDFCRKIGITPVKFHDLRATFITQLLINGESVARVMATVGHAELKTTQGYLRLCGNDIKGVTENLNITLPEDSALDNVVELKRNS